MFVLGLLVGYTQLQASLYIKNDDINKRERVAGNVFTVQFFFLLIFKKSRSVEPVEQQIKLEWPCKKMCSHDSTKCSEEAFQ